MIVGAGFAGLTAARELVQLGHDVVVLEGRDRVGGRSCTTTLAGVPVDLGATFVGPTQDEVLKLAADLGIQPVPTHDDGDNLIRWCGRVRSYWGTIPRAVIPRAARPRPCPLASRPPESSGFALRAVDGGGPT